jgi:hypothetical protein
VQQNQIKKGSSLIEVLIRNQVTGVEEKKKVPLSWTISNLRNYFAKVHKIPVNVR